MDAKDLRSTCMNLENQKSVRITTKDVEQAKKDLARWHSRKEAHRNYRKEFMLQYIPDIQDIST